MTERSLKPLLAKLVSGAILAEDEARHAFDVMMAGDATQAQMGAFLMALAMRGESIDEIVGAVRTMRARMERVHAPAGAVDCCGTGGDGAHTLNISTAAAFVVAGCGVPVAKHGNRAASSKSGAADVLEALGVRLDPPLAALENSLAMHKVAFLMATRHHPSMRHVGPTRGELALRTLFNLTGPLANPAGVKRQLLGVALADKQQMMADVLQRLGAEAFWIVHGHGGLDELSLSGPSHVIALADGKRSEFAIAPRDADLAEAPIDAVRGGDAEHNAHALRLLLDGTKGPYRDIVVLNAAATLIVAGAAGSIRDAAAMAASSVDQGKAKRALDGLIQVTQGTP
ncbi:anthranilate phosphoribosyltransferase [Roseiterribacter gracilis]|uniref:Anthranilate phosphoribosyltransferase n=1 Tax=Roseiterribacter gracilis TaxID=2812848 RepID=A0A8S8X7P5_9PROT|nr:anthranilate phosphoribosyltransferase [Rhodospirillales bacterium TMPK1]